MKKRYSIDECLDIYNKGIGEIGKIAHEIKLKRFGTDIFFNKNFHIEPTNICLFDCKFCAYSKEYQKKDEGWELSAEDMLKIVRDKKNIDATEVHIVGGVHPKLTLEFFGNLIKEIKKINPKLHIKAFTAVELDYMFRKAKKTYKEGFEYLTKCGLNSIPGGGAEIFDKEIRKKICDDKCTTEKWLSIHETAHSLGLKSNATMLYGHYENIKHRLEHMQILRELQDKTGGFNCFIPLKFRSKNNQMSNLGETSIIDDFKTYAISRIFLDNFDHIKVYWPMIGRETSQTLLSFGVDDIDGTIDDTTKIYSMAGAEEKNPSMTTSEIVSLIKDVNFRAIERDTMYNKIKEH